MDFSMAISEDKQSSWKQSFEFKVSGSKFKALKWYSNRCIVFSGQPTMKKYSNMWYELTIQLFLLILLGESVGNIRKSGWHLQLFPFNQAWEGNICKILEIWGFPASWVLSQSEESIFCFLFNSSRRIGKPKCVYHPKCAGQNQTCLTRQTGDPWPPRKCVLVISLNHGWVGVMMTMLGALMDAFHDVQLDAKGVHRLPGWLPPQISQEESCHLKLLWSEPNSPDSDNHAGWCRG